MNVVGKEVGKAGKEVGGTKVGTEVLSKEEKAKIREDKKKAREEKKKEKAEAKAAKEKAKAEAKAAKEKAKAAKEELKKKAIPNWAYGYMFKILQVLAKKGNMEAMKKFFEEPIKYDPNFLPVSKYNYGRPLLHHAVETSSPEIINYLVLQGSDLKLRDKYDYTPLICAVRACKYDNVLELIKLGADVHVKDINGMNLLHHTDDINIIKKLIELGVGIKDCNHKNCVRNLLEHYNGGWGDCSKSIALIKEIVKLGADINTKLGHNDDTLIMLNYGRDQKIKELIKLGCWMLLENKNGHNVFDEARKQINYYEKSYVDEAKKYKSSEYWLKEYSQTKQRHTGFLKEYFGYAVEQLEELFNECGSFRLDKYLIHEIVKYF
jgi:hypothetical protein